MTSVPRAVEPWHQPGIPASRSPALRSHHYPSDEPSHTITAPSIPRTPHRAPLHKKNHQKRMVRCLQKKRHITTRKRRAPTRDPITHPPPHHLPATAQGPTPLCPVRRPPYLTHQRIGGAEPNPLGASASCIDRPSGVDPTPHRCGVLPFGRSWRSPMAGHGLGYG